MIQTGSAVANTWAIANHPGLWGLAKGDRAHLSMHAMGAIVIVIENVIALNLNRNEAS